MGKIKLGGGSSGGIGFASFGEGERMEVLGVWMREMRWGTAVDGEC